MSTHTRLPEIFFIIGLILIILLPATSAEIIADKTANDFRVIWDYEQGLTEQSFIISVQNLQPTGRTVSISSLLNQTSFNIEQVDNIQFKEWKLLPYNYTIDHYNYINHSEWNETNQTWDNWTESIFNYTETVESTKLGWKPAKSLIFQNNGVQATDTYDEILIPKYDSKEKEGTVNGTKIFRLLFDTPITRTSAGWGSSGYVSIWIDGIEYCPYWNSTFDIRRPILINNTAGDAVTEFQLISENLSSFTINASSAQIVNSTSGLQEAHWNQSVDVNGNLEYVWANYSSLPNGSWINSTYYIYCQSAPTMSSASDGDATFLQYRGSATADYLDSLVIDPTTDSVVYESRAKIIPGTHNIVFGLSNTANLGDDYIYVQSYNVVDLRYLGSSNEDVYTKIEEAPDLDSGSYFKAKFTYDLSTIIGYIDEDQISTTITTNLPNENLGLFLWEVNGAITQDWAFVRKYTTNEPEPWTVGDAEYYTDSLHYNNTSPYNYTIESDGTLTANRTIITADDTNWTAAGNGNIIFSSFDISATTLAQYSLTGTQDYIQAVNLTTGTTYELQYVGNSTTIESQTASSSQANFTIDLTAGTYKIVATDLSSNAPGIADGVYGFSTGDIPSNATILPLKNESIVTIEMSINWDTINATTWSTFKDAMTYAYDQNRRTGIRLNFGDDYTASTYRTAVMTNFSTYLPDLLDDPYQIEVQFITLNFTNTSASDAEKTAFTNTISANLSDNTDSRFNIITRENLTGLDSYTSVTPIKYINLTNKSNWIDDEVRILRGNTTRSRMYGGNTSFLDSVLNHKTGALGQMRGTSDTDNQYTETNTVKLDNGDIILYNNASTTANITIANVGAGTYWDMTNDAYLNLTATGTLHFNVSATSHAYIINDTFSKIIFISNSTSRLWGADTTSNLTTTYINTSTPDASYLWAGDNTDMKFEFWDPYYTRTNTMMVYYGWINASVITNWSEYQYIVIADQNGDEINNTINRSGYVYGYISLADYADTAGWQAAKEAEADVWIDTYGTKIFIDGIDGVVAGNNFSSRFKDLVNHVMITKDRDAILNTYTVYQEFATLGDAVMKESFLSRWDGSVSDPTYSWEDMDIEKERAAFYNSHNIPVLGMSFGAVDDYEKMAFTSFGFAVLHGFDGNNSWRYGQPNFQSQTEVEIYPFGTMLESTYTETSSADWNRLYSAGRVHINPVDHTYWIDDNMDVNNIEFNIYLHSGGVGSGDRNVSVYVNNMSNSYIIEYDTPTLFTWYEKSVSINTADYNTTGHYNIYACTRPDVGGWNSIGQSDLTGAGTHTWYDTTTVNLPDNHTGQTWNALQSDRNFMVSLNTNVTTSAYLDTLDSKITQSSTRATGNTTTTLSSTNDYNITLWSQTVTLITTSASTTWFKATNGTWVEATVNTVSDASAAILNWGYTTIDGYTYGAVREMVDSTTYIYRYLFPHLSEQQVITQTNVAPILSTIGNKSVTAGQYLNFTASATDANSDTLTYSDNSSLFNVNSSTGAVSWLSNSSSAGTYTINFSVSDGLGGIDNENITLTVSNVSATSSTFTYSNQSVSSITLLQGHTVTISVDVSNDNYTINSVLAKIRTPGGLDTNYTMTNSAGDTWAYTYTTSILGTHQIPYFYATTNISTTNTTTSSLYFITLHPAGSSGGSSGGTIPTPTPTPTPTPPVDDDTGTGDNETILDNVTTYLSDTFLKDGMIDLSGSGLIELKKTRIYWGTGEQYIFTTSNEAPGVIGCTAYTESGRITDQFYCQADDSGFTLARKFTPGPQLVDTETTLIKLTMADGSIKTLYYHITIINTAAYLPCRFSVPLSNPYIIATDTNGMTTGIRLMALSVVGLMGLSLLVIMERRGHLSKLFDPTSQRVKIR